MARGEALARKADLIVQVPATLELLAPVLLVLPLRLLAYHIAPLRGCDVGGPATGRRAPRWSEVGRPARGTTRRYR